MLRNCPCPDNNESVILYQTDPKKKQSKIDVECTSILNTDKEHWKPSLYKCKKCNLIFSEYIGVDFEKSYSYVVDKAYLEQIEFKTKTFKIFFNKIKEHLNQNSTILEIGSYYGILGKLIKPHVKNYTGLELSIHAVEYSKKNFNLNIINQSLVKFLEKKLKFDVIIMTDVIEHLDKPFDVIDLIEKNLTKNGVLILSTFDMDSIVPRITRSKYHWIIPMHKYYFSSTTLKYFLNKSNLHVFKVKTDTRLVSIEYFLNILIVLTPALAIIFKFFLRLDFFKKLSIKINLLDLKIYFTKKKLFK